MMVSYIKRKYLARTDSDLVKEIKKFRGGDIFSLLSSIHRILSNTICPMVNLAFIGT
jgi:hypothetical protein